MSERNPVLLIHGLNDTIAVFDKMSSYLENLGLEVHRLNLTPNNGTAKLETKAAQVASYIENNFKSDRYIDLIGFSMGGIVTRYYLQRMGGVKRVQRYINISAPNNGTLTAYLLPFPGIAQMRPDSLFLKDLNEKGLDLLEQLNLTVIWTPFDLMILPASSSQMSVGRSVQLPVLSHDLMLLDHIVLKTVAQALLEPIKPRRANPQ